MPNLIFKLRGRLHYSWIIVAILAVVQIVGQSIGMAAGVIVPPLNDPNGSFGWNMGTIGAALAVYYLVGALFSPISGWLGDRYGPRRLTLVAGVLYAGSMIFLGMVTQLWQFFLAFGVLLSVTQSLAMVPLMASVSRWFTRRLGLRRRAGTPAGIFAGQYRLAGHLLGHRNCRRGSYSPAHSGPEKPTRRPGNKALRGD